MPTPVDKKRVTALFFRRVGDSLMATPALRAVKRRTPGVTLTVVAGKHVARVFEFNPWIDHMVTVKSAPSVLRLAAAARQHGRPDVVLDFLSDPRSALATMLSGASERIGFAYPWRWHAYTTRVALQDTAHPVYSAIHKLKMAAALGAEETDYATDFYLSADDHEFAAAAWQERGWSADSAVCAFFVHSRRSQKRWPLGAFCELICRLEKEGAGIPLVLVTPGDESAVSELRARACLHAQNVLTITDLGRLGAVLSRCRVLIGNDGGPKHIAVALNVPTVTVFPTGSAAFWTPPAAELHLALAPSVAGGGVEPSLVYEAALTSLRSPRR